MPTFGALRGIRLISTVRRRDSVPLAEETMLGIAAAEPPVEDALICAEEQAELRLALSRLRGHYRRVIVCHYYEEMPILDIAAHLGLSVEMVKFYLRAGRQKLKEGLFMIGEKSINPKPLCVYRSGEWCKVDVWQVLSRKLPCQIAHRLPRCAPHRHGNFHRNWHACRIHRGGSGAFARGRRDDSSGKGQISHEFSYSQSRDDEADW